MSLGNRLLVPFVVLFISVSPAFALSSTETPLPPQPHQPPQPRSPQQTAINTPAAKTKSTIEIGSSFQMWNEKISVSRDSISSHAYANYAGLALGAEKNWTRRRWVYGLAMAVATGKAAASGFGSNLSFNDGVNRSWWSAQLSGFDIYRLNTIFGFGFGIFSRYRSADWTPKDSTLQVKPMSNTLITGEVILRWQIAHALTLMQTYIPLDLNGSSMWQWTAQLTF